MSFLVTNPHIVLKHRRRVKYATLYREKQVYDMLDFLIDNVFVTFGGTIFQQKIGITIGTKSVPLLTGLSLY